MTPCIMIYEYLSDNINVISTALIGGDGPMATLSLVGMPAWLHSHWWGWLHGYTLIGGDGPMATLSLVGMAAWLHSHGGDGPMATLSLVGMAAWFHSERYCSMPVVQG